MKKVVLCGGGTGGHIFPSIAVGELLKKEGCDLFYIGVNGKPEEKIAEEHGIEFYGYDFSGFPRGVKKELVTWPFNLLKAVSKAKIYLKHFKPDVVFGTGGYSAAPDFEPAPPRAPAHAKDSIAGLKASAHYPNPPPD
jgi:UDP-N-acetylglucosamine--N-acetylmuramyl-(pentapeptide) pyrophosphoryl-undecaprenol N-acetylglucosamine transferase